jgi:hypothetical protein
MDAIVIPERDLHEENEDIMIAGNIYKVDEESIWWEEGDTYCYAIPAGYVLPTNYIGDCWIVDVNRNIHPGYDASPIPLQKESLIPL